MKKCASRNDDAHLDTSLSSNDNDDDSDSDGDDDNTNRLCSERKPLLAR